MKNLSVRLLVLVSFGVIIYFLISNNTNEVKKEIVNITNEVDTISENVEETEINEVEIQTKEEINPILVQGQTNVYSNGDIFYTVELDTLDRILITHVVPSKSDEGWFWTKKHCTFKNNYIYVDWITTEYYIKNNELIVVESGKSTKFILTENILKYR